MEFFQKITTTTIIVFNKSKDNWHFAVTTVLVHAKWRRSCQQVTTVKCTDTSRPTMALSGITVVATVHLHWIPSGVTYF
jgi:hypothetical protein